ncbi:lysophospholipid acyltransferase family protein [Spirosoma luteolum]
MFFFRFLAWLPLWALYGLADFLYVVLFYLVRYRRAVVEENIRLSFPEKSPAERQAITRGFYRNLTDLLVETLKLPGLSADELRRRVEFTGMDMVRQLIADGHVIIAMTSHSSNWEWIPSAIVLAGVPIDSVYKTLTSPFSEELVRGIRGHFGAVPVPMNTLPRRMVQAKNIPRLIGMVADQVPDVPEHAHWMPFLHRDTPFYPGSERLARSRNLPVVYVDVVRVRRGHYHVTFSKLAEPPYTELPHAAILERYRDRIEQTIREHPSDWLWSHKRWKHWRGKYAKVGAKFD